MSALFEMSGWLGLVHTSGSGAASGALRRHGNAVGSAVAFTLTGSWPVGS
jgi:hypothetical protein